MKLDVGRTNILHFLKIIIDLESIAKSFHMRNAPLLFVRALTQRGKGKLPRYSVTTLLSYWSQCYRVTGNRGSAHRVVVLAVVSLVVVVVIVVVVVVLVVVVEVK